MPYLNQFRPSAVHLVGSGVMLILLLAVACGTATPPTPTPTATKAPAPAVAPKATPLPAAAATPVPTVAPAPTPVGEVGRYGGTLVVALPANPPTLDPRQETTFAVIQPAAPMFSTLTQYDPLDYPKIIPDLAESWGVAKDGVSWTFKLKKGVKFHDGSVVTSKDVKNTFDIVIKPPTGFRSPREAVYQPIIDIQTPDDSTVVFKTAFPWGSFVDNMNSAWNTIPPVKYPFKDMMTAPIGSGPFKFVKFVPGQLIEMEKNPDYFVPGRPYLDRIQFIVMVELATRAAALRTGRADIEFRDMPPKVKDDIVKALGDKVNVQETGWTCLWDAAAQTQRGVTADKRVRLALNYAIDHKLGAEVLFPLTGLKEPGTMVRFGSKWSPTRDELEKLPSWEPDPKARKERAKELLREAGFPEGIKLKVSNRNIPNPYFDYANFLIDQWRQVGITTESTTLETAAWFTAIRSGEFEIAITANCDAYDDPDRFYGARQPGNLENFSQFQDPKVVELFGKQQRILDFNERLRVVKELEAEYWKNAYYIKGYWGTRRVVHWKSVRNYVAPPNHYSNQKLQDVWLAPQ